MIEKRLEDGGSVLAGSRPRQTCVDQIEDGWPVARATLLGCRLGALRQHPLDGTEGTAGDRRIDVGECEMGVALQESASERSRHAPLGSSDAPIQTGVSEEAIRHLGREHG
jgi:hypothetical protein